jgi:antitoxin VapB
MSLNIKNDEADRLARELAGLTGETVTGAVTQALRDRLDRERHKRKRKATTEQLMAIAADVASRLKEPWKSIDHDKLLYDKKTGLPRVDDEDL